MGQTVTPCPKCTRPNKLISPHPSGGCCIPPVGWGYRGASPPPPKPSPGTFTGQRVQRLRRWRLNAPGGPRPLLPLRRGRAAAKGHAWPNPGGGGAQPDGGGVSLGHPSPCWGSFIMEEPLMEGKFFPPQGTQSPPYPLPRELGGLNFPPQGD